MPLVTVRIILVLSTAKKFSELGLLANPAHGAQLLTASSPPVPASLTTCELTGFCAAVTLAAGRFEPPAPPHEANATAAPATNVMLTRILRYSMNPPKI